MANNFGFIARTSVKRPSHYYIDCDGEYRIAELAKNKGLNMVDIRLIYVENGGVHDDEQDVYYFNSIEAATKSISQIISKIPKENLGRALYLSEAEIEYIRKALINENSNKLSSKVKDNIFKKLNG